MKFKLRSWLSAATGRLRSTWHRGVRQPMAGVALAAVAGIAAAEGWRVLSLPRFGDGTTAAGGGGRSVRDADGALVDLPSKATLFTCQDAVLVRRRHGVRGLAPPRVGPGGGGNPGAPSGCAHHRRRRRREPGKCFRPLPARHRHRARPAPPHARDRRRLELAFHGGPGNRRDRRRPPATLPRAGGRGMARWPPRRGGRRPGRTDRFRGQRRAAA